MSQVALGDLFEDATFNFDFNTQDASDLPITLVSGAIGITVGSSSTVITAGLTLTTDFGSVTGKHHVTGDLSADAGYTPQSDFSVSLTAGTVDGNSVVGKILARGSIQNQYHADDLITAVQTAVDGIAANQPNPMATGQTTSGSTASVIFDTARTESIADYWEGMLLRLVGGAMDQMCRPIVGYDEVGKSFVVSPPFPQAVAAGVDYELVPDAAFVPGVKFIAAGTPDATTIPTNLTGLDVNQFATQFILMITGSEAGVSKAITANTTGGTLTVNTMTTAVVAGDRGRIIGSRAA